MQFFFFFFTEEGVFEDPNNEIKIFWN